MRKKRIRRTLKKRIRRALSMTSFITVVIISGLMLAVLLKLTINLVTYQATTIADAIYSDIRTGDAAKAMGVSSIDKMNMKSPMSRIWIEGIDQRTILNDFIDLPESEDDIIIIVEMNGETMYSNDTDSDQELFKYFQDTEVEKVIYDSYNNEIGTIKVRVNGLLIVELMCTVIGVVIAISLAALFISKAISMLMVFPIIKPINHLEKKFKAIADGDVETAANTQLVVKRPLREIESLIDSTNNIMKKLQGYNEILENQKDILEEQNSELEMQNEELIQSKLHIQEQQGQLIQSEKMASVGMLTAAITHEINTPIGAINSNAQLEDMLLMQLINHPGVVQDEELNMIASQLKEVNDVNLDACSRIIEIIKSLKSYSRIDQADFQEANINEGIKSVLVLTRNLLKRRITVHEDYGDIPIIKCFPGQLNQVFMNIIVNASQAIEGEGEIFISTHPQEENIYITIRDTGTGIKSEDISKLFDPGFTTKGVGIGLGLGLYISYNIIQKHQGEITVNSEPGKGAEFIIKIPNNLDAPR